MAAQHPEQRVTRDIGPLSLRAAVVPDSLDEENRTVEVVWTTGARVKRRSFDQYWEELSLDPKHVRMDRLRNGAPLLDSHRSFETRGVVGVVEDARLEPTRGVATVRFARDAASDAIFRKVADGILRQVSIGYGVHRYEQLEAGEDGIPVYRATDWEPAEISMVPIGADAGAGVRSVGAETNPCVFVERDLEMNMAKTKDSNTRSAPTATATTTEHQADHPATHQTEQRVEPTDEVVNRARAEAASAERGRIESIHRTARVLGLDAELVGEHVRNGTPVDQFRSIAEDAYEQARPPIVSDAGRAAITPGEDARDKWLRGAENWLLVRAAVDNLVVDAAKKRGETVRVDPGEFRGLGLVDLARASLDRGGVRTAGMDKMTLVGKALTHRSGGYAATGDFPVLLENVMHKVLLASYGITPDIWSRICATGSVSDFRPHSRYRMGSFGRLSPVNEHGEFKNQSIPDGRKEQISADTKGNIIGLSRQALINDDMGAFSRIATMIGRAARLSIEGDVFDMISLNGGLGPLMIDGDTLFHANHGNIGTSSVLSVAGIDGDRQVMAEQTDESGNEFLDLRPAILLVPIGLGGDARVINDAQYDVDPVAANSTNHFQRPNKVRGLFRDIVDTPRLSGTRRYELADPNIAPVFEVVFLEGQQTPFLELKDGWRIDGVEWKVRLDYGVGAIDFRGAVTNAGA